MKTKSNTTFHPRPSQASWASRLGAILITLGALAGGACAPNPDDCTVKGDEAACIKLCETGKPELTHTCYTIRARKLVACAESGEGCEEACADWTNASSSETIRDYYLANIGDDAKVKAIEAKCGGATP